MPELTAEERLCRGIVEVDARIPHGSLNARQRLVVKEVFGAAIRDAEAAQRERDIALICQDCRDGHKPNEHGFHLPREHVSGTFACRAAAIRRAGEE